MNSGSRYDVGVVCDSVLCCFWLSISPGTPRAVFVSVPVSWRFVFRFPALAAGSSLSRVAGGDKGRFGEAVECCLNQECWSDGLA